MQSQTLSSISSTLRASLILNLLEEQFWLTELGTSLEQICAAELSPLEVRHIDHFAEFLRRVTYKFFSRKTAHINKSLINISNDAVSIGYRDDPFTLLP